jgi:hypothetical protein
MPALDDKDRAMLAFVAKAVNSPESIAKSDMDRLHTMDWAIF